MTSRGRQSDSDPQRGITQHDSLFAPGRTTLLDTLRDGLAARLDVVDALRGFALFGVAVSNLAVFAGTGAIAAVHASRLDTQVGLVTSYLITGKFLALFALTFGVSFGLYLRRCDQLHEPIIGRYLRRIGGLFLIGAVHRVLPGSDILMTYAVLGLVLLLLRNASDRVLLVVAVCSLALPELWRSLLVWLEYLPLVPSISRAERLRLATEGPYLELVRVRAWMLTGWWYGFLGQSSSYLALFLVGLWTARSRLLEQHLTRRSLLIACVGGLALAVCGYFLQPALSEAMETGAYWIQATFGIVWRATTFLQAIGYGAGIALLWSGGGFSRRLLAVLVPAGRMALKNYLAISALVTVVVMATGSYGRVSVAVASGLGVLLWLLELAMSAWWLRRFQLGPAEWLWRLMTNAALPKWIDRSIAK